MATEEYLTLLPFTDDGDRTFQCVLGGKVYNFRLYFTQGPEDFWLLDITDEEGNELATGRRLVLGSVNFLKGFANELGTIAATVTLIQGTVHDTTAPAVNLNVIWWDDPADNPFTVADPMDNIMTRFAWLS